MDTNQEPISWRVLINNKYWDYKKFIENYNQTKIIYQTKGLQHMVTLPKKNDSVYYVLKQQIIMKGIITSDGFIIGDLHKNDPCIIDKSKFDSLTEYIECKITEIYNSPYKRVKHIGQNTWNRVNLDNYIIHDQSPRTSWALWNINGDNNQEFFDENTNELHSRVIYLEYNQANKLKSNDYEPFIFYHNTDVGSKRLKQFIQEDNLENILGCFMTDLLIVEPTPIKNSLEVLKDQLIELEQSYKTRYIICSGDDTFNHLCNELKINKHIIVNNNIKKSEASVNNEKWIIYRVWRQNWGVYQYKNDELKIQLKFINDETVPETNQNILSLPEININIPSPSQPETNENITIPSQPETNENEKIVHYIYLIHIREFYTHNKNIYKFGRTSQLANNRIDRLESYPKCSKIILLIECNDSLSIENKIKKEFRKNKDKFKKHDDGYEHIIGDKNDIIDLIIRIVRENN